MRAVVQRVDRASVTVDEKITGRGTEGPSGAFGCGRGRYR